MGNLDVWSILYTLTVGGCLIYSLWAIWESLEYKDGMDLLVSSVCLAGFTLALAWSWMALPLLLFCFLILTAVHWMREERRKTQQAAIKEIQALHGELHELRRDIHLHRHTVD